MANEILRNEVRTLHRVAGNLEPFSAFLKNQDGSVVDLTTGQTVKFRLVRLRDKQVIVNDAAATVISTGTAEVKYQPNAGETDLGAGRDSDQHAIYWKVRKGGTPDILIPYDGPREIVLIQGETVKE